MNIARKNYPLMLRNLVVWFLLAATLVLMLRGFLMIRSERYPVRELDGGWTIERNGSMQKEDALSRYNTGNIAYGETFLLTRVLDAAPELPSACLFFRNMHCAVTIRLDGEIIYTDGIENYTAHRLVGRRLCFVPLPASYAEKELSLELTAAEPNSIYGLGPYWFGLEQDLFTFYLKDRHYAFYIALFLCIFGVIQLLWLPFLVSADASYIKLLFSALTTLLFGMYLLGYYNLYDLFTDIPDMNTMLEYMAFYLVTCAICGYIASSTEGKWRLVYSALVVFDILVVLLELTLHFMNAVHFTRFLVVCYAISIPEIIPYQVKLLMGWRKHRKTYYDRLEEIADRILALGSLTYICGIVIDGSVFMYTRYSGGQESAVRIPFATWTSLVYSFALCINYFLHGIMFLRTEATRQKLQKKAYSDSLTALSNRGECELVLNRLGRESRSFSIISFDLDELKQVNDTLGHAEGDRMLRAFSTILTDTFADAKLIGRMGGDEFIVILTEGAADKTEELLRSLSEKIEAFNREETMFRLGISYGIAKSGEGRYGRRAHDIYMLADARMYNMKRGHRR